MSTLLRWEQMDKFAGEHLIELEQAMAGYRRFFGVWLFCDSDNVIVDVGPAASAFRLTNALSLLGVDRLDYVFLTHVHIDHAGALEELLKYYPEAKVICHEKAVTHLTDPAVLWERSLSALGETATLFGKPKAVERERLIPHTMNEIRNLKVIETPGHSAHHLAFEYKGRLFVGEAAGVYFSLGDSEYLRPASPPTFWLDSYLDSIGRMLGFPDQPLRYAHFGGAESSHRLLTMLRGQVLRWQETIADELSRGSVNILERCMEALISRDPCLRGFYEMDDDTRKREISFIANGVRGFVEYLEKKGI